ncbi:alpha/beta fold hydrolase [Mesobaculum littorinae]|uniref:Alpha/beta fold hydrolase n=1 Tax=Mesobaculum littorinae TaxID=2486419 RepID=A0A438AIF5_9RHOB|nr:alpha/beta fold hydrolase [Mesobaculum littorinae]RVV98415.1 alpha/beta fold hydrolase [Mesobaculum littorinae]
MRLHRVEAGSGGRPLLIVPGLFGSARNWGVIQKRLSDRGRVVAVDMRNHGASGWSDTHDYAAMAADLAHLIEAEGAEDGWDVLGHSMGGKAAMMLALTAPELVHRLIVADIAPVAYEHSQMHLIEAMRGLDLAGLRSRSDADARLAGTVSDRGVRAFLLQSLDWREGCWTLNLDVLGREMATITGWPDPQGSFPRGALFLSGGESDYVLPAHRDRIRGLFPKARFARIPGAGHWLHAEKPREVEASMRAFLDA